jgi:hypothetical protein
MLATGGRKTSKHCALIVIDEREVPR